MGPTAKPDDVPQRVERGPKREDDGREGEDDGREGAISGRLARKATGVSPSGFARTGVFAGNFTDCHWDAPAGDTGDSGDAGAPGKRATERAGVWGGAPPRTPISQSANQPISQSANQPISQSANQPISQSANQPISVSAPRSAHSWGRSREWSSVRMDWARRRATRGRASWMPVW